MSAASRFRLASTVHPLLYEVNSRVLVNEWTRRSGTQMTLGALPDALLNSWASLEFDAIWTMGVWQTGRIGREIAVENPGLREEYKRVLPDIVDDDIGGSPYAVQAYEPAAKVGGPDGLANLRERLHERGIVLILDFVCNHTARDHAWIRDHPEFYVQGAVGDEVKYPDRYFRAETSQGPKAVAYGRDPYFPGWTDTAQLDYRNPDLRKRMVEQLVQIAGICDGVRCDMAMLVLNDVFVKTWPSETGRIVDEEFWGRAIRGVKRTHPGFLFLAEAYWNREWELQQLGFDFTYDKTLYDRLVREGAGAVRDHLKAEMAYQLHCARFIENHDEKAAAEAMPSEAWHFAAAVVAGTIPGMLLIQDGQLEGRSQRIPVQLVRRPDQTANPHIARFYQSLLRVLGDPVFRKGIWLQLFPRPAWGESHSWGNFIASWWHEDTEGDRMVVVNYAPLNSQCYFDIPLDLIIGQSLEFRDMMGPAVYVRDRAGLESKGMFFDLTAYGFHIFAIRALNR
jgi:hypothetical protein